MTGEPEAASDYGAAVRVMLLGAVRVWRGERELDMGPPQRRAVLTVLALAAGRTVTHDELIDAVWDVPPNKVDSTLHCHISRLRGALAPGHDPRAPVAALARSGPGYVLRAEPGNVDALAFTIQVAAARRARGGGDLVTAARLLDDALRFWHGGALAGIDGRWAQAQRTRLEEARLAALEEHAQVKLALGCHAEMTAELAGLIGKHPLRESLRGLLMTALYRSGRQAEALAVYHDTRRVLDAELGIEPCPQLQRLHERVLAADPALSLAPLAPTLVSGAVSVVPRELPADVSAFTGRVAELAELDALLPPVQAGEGAPAGPMAISAVVGPAGVGKTALAVHWAHRVAERFPDGQLYINLRGSGPGRPVQSADALGQFLRSLEVSATDIPQEETERAARYRSVVAGKRLLVMLDNAATADQVRPLLPGSGTAMVVVTSRDSLPRLIARDGAHRLDMDPLPAVDAVALLRALIGSRAEDDLAAAQVLAGLCARLPLVLRIAAELAVSRPATSLAELVTELADLPGRLDPLGADGDSPDALALWQDAALADVSLKVPYRAKAPRPERIDPAGARQQGATRHRDIAGVHRRVPDAPSGGFAEARAR